MRGYGGRHLDLSSGGGEDEAPVLPCHLLRLRGAAQRCQRGQRGPHVPAGAHTLPQVSPPPPQPHPQTIHLVLLHYCMLLSTLNPKVDPHVDEGHFREPFPAL